MIHEAYRRVVDFFREAPEPGEIGLVLSGGGARSAYQAGVLQYIAETFPHVEYPIMTGVSAGAINIAHLANHPGAFPEAAQILIDNWKNITAEQVFRSASSFRLLKRLMMGNGSDSLDALQHEHGLLDTHPLRTYLQEKLKASDGQLHGVTDNVHAGRLKACAVITTNYTTGQTVTWVQGREIRHWERPNRISVQATLSVEHIMASTALPVLFPAIRIGEAWYGDGGIRLTAPLSPAIHMGARRILAISTRYNRSKVEADEPMVYGYPPAAQIMGILMNAIFLDMLDQDAATLRRINHLLRHVPRSKRDGLRPITLLLLRPSVDLGKLARAYELQLTGALSLLTRGLGTGETKSPDWLSMLLFDREYTSRLVDIGYEDARRQRDILTAFFEGHAIDRDPQQILSSVPGDAQLVY